MIQDFKDLTNLVLETAGVTVLSCTKNEVFY